MGFLEFANRRTSSFFPPKFISSPTS